MMKKYKYQHCYCNYVGSKFISYPGRSICNAFVQCSCSSTFVYYRITLCRTIQKGKKGKFLVEQKIKSLIVFVHYKNAQILPKNIILDQVYLFTSHKYQKQTKYYSIRTPFQQKVHSLGSQYKLNPRQNRTSIRFACDFLPIFIKYIHS